MGMIILNIIINLMIKAGGNFKFSNIVEEVHQTEISSMLIFMNKDLFDYNPIIISCLYFMVFIVFLITISNLLCLINVLTQNKIIVAGIAIIIFAFIMYDGNFGEGKTLTSYLAFNHIEISYSGFGISDNRYINIIHSLIYLISSNIILFYIGIRFSKVREIFAYKRNLGEVK